MSEERDDARPKPQHLDLLSEVWRRVHEHKLVQWCVAYVALAYGFQHALVLTSESFEWPQAVARISMLLLALGLPVVMTLAWYHGERASRRISGPELTIISILLVIGSLLFFVLVQPEEIAGDAARDAPVKTLAIGGVPSPATPGGISIAVLPFANLSDDREQEFFSDGMTEEINGALAKVPSLQVVARTSAFQFKGQNQDVRMVGQALGATHVIEGSVRRAGNRVRISAQLVRADSGLQLWSENYDRDLTDIFAIQEEIASAIAGALRARLQEGQRLVSSRTNDLDSYEQYLRAKALIRFRGLPAMEEAITLLEQAVAHAPEYAPAWALLGEAYALMPQYYTGARSEAVEDVRRIASIYLPKAEAAGQRAIQLDPSNADGYLPLGLVQENRGKYLLADDFYSKALALDRNDPDLLHFYSGMLAEVGRLKEALATRQRLQVLEPFVPVFVTNTALLYWLNGQDDTALALLRGLAPSRGQVAGGRNLMARILLSHGRYGEAADAVLQLPPENYRPGTLEAVADVLRNAGTASARRQTLPPSVGNLSFVYFYIGDPERMLEFYEEQVDADFRNIIAAPWHRSYASLRKSERFKTLVRGIGVVDYWRVRGWPDFCRPIGADDFTCD